ncbi:2-oxo acid dehydrogenase subunit E2 [Streptomyces sp. DW26H14]|uniref:2-oxo acid dehydrogenase subunit E2 n=1 Tax=Streptomyces sp. DW26H14 TaxID=3435395 RepID=UPI00403DEEFC
MTTDTSAAAGLREFKMPDVGEGLTEAEILKWYVGPGDSVTDGQVVCEVETAKAAVELPIPYDGVVRELRFEEGSTVDVGIPIIMVDTGGGAGPAAPEAAPEASRASDASGASGTSGTEEPANGVAPASAPARTPVLVGYGVSESSTKRRPRRPAGGVPGQAATAETPRAAPEPEPEPVAAPEPPPAQPAGGRPLAKPPVRKLAKDLGVDLAAIAPSGPDGIVTREDVRAAAAPAPEQARAASAPSEAPAAPDEAAREPEREPAVSAVAAGARETRTPIRGVRKATAAAMVGSAFTAPHVTEFVTVDVTRTVKLVEELKADPDMAGLRVNPLLLIARALLVAIRRNPAINAAWDEAGQEIVQKHYVNLGIAAATPRGLIVPNIKDAHDKTLPQLAESLAELVATAREGRTSPGAMQGGTVTITNVGVFGIDSGTPILNPGEAAILAVGAIKPQPWVHKGKVKPRQVTTLALSFDHRLVDGELGSKVLADVAAVLEQPKRLITWA